ncbi:MAG TPA: response regulator [Polyangiaceae bacterium]
MSTPKRLKVMVVDDDAVVLEVVRTRLTRAGHQVIVRDSAIGTTQHVALEAPDVVLVDLDMSTISGVELAKMIRKSRAKQGTLVILHTGVGQEELERLVGKDEAARTLHKSLGELDFMQGFKRLTARAATA